jgi:hypothetical protein
LPDPEYLTATRKCCIDFDLDMDGENKTLRITGLFCFELATQDENKAFKKQFPDEHNALNPADRIDFIETLFPIRIERESKTFRSHLPVRGYFKVSEIKYQIYEKEPYGMLPCDKTLQQTDASTDDRTSHTHVSTRAKVRGKRTTWGDTCKGHVAAFFNYRKRQDGFTNTYKELYEAYKQKPPHEKIKSFEDFKRCIEACKKKSTRSTAPLIPPERKAKTGKRCQ